jgi:protein-disulfide isomerase
MLSHENSKLLAAVGKYGNAINQFESFYHRLYQKQDSLNIENITEYFSDLVPDTADFRNRITQSSQPAIEADIQLIKDFQIKGAPAFIILDQLHLGLKTDENMRKALDEALMQKKNNQ